MASPTIPMLDPNGNPGDVPVAQVQQALAAGGKMGADILDPAGNPGIIPQDQLPAALKAGAKSQLVEGYPRAKDSITRTGLERLAVAGQLPPYEQARASAVAKMKAYDQANAATPWYKFWAGPPSPEFTNAEHYTLQGGEGAKYGGNVGASEGSGLREGLATYDEQSAGQMYQGAKEVAHGDIAKGGHHIISGAMTGATPIMAPAIAANPVAAARAIATGYAFGKGASAATGALGGNQDQQDLAGDIGNLAGGAIGAGASAKNLSKITPDSVQDFLGKAKTALFTTAEERANAKLPVKSAQQVNSEALPDLHEQVGGVLDKAADAKGVDTTGEDSLSAKAAQGGAGWKASGQQKYKIADELAQEATGQDGAIQRFGQAVQNAKETLANPELTAEEMPVAQERLQNAQAQLDAVVQHAKSKGIDVDALVRAADKEYSTGLSLEEFGRGVLQQETAAGGLKPSTRPLDAPVRNLTAAASKRGHVLANAVGEQDSATIQKAVADAQNSIQAGKAQTAAAKAGQQRVSQVNKNRLKVAGALGTAGYLYAKGHSVASALSGGSDH